ncbi:MAG: GTP-binding protein [Sphaerochaeta sp.]|nr:GTP-binding protein [Sphaerochaeta sp.]
MPPAVPFPTELRRTLPPIGLHIVTGFLGSGKTSVINSLLGHLKDRKIALITNDFGPIAVDSALVAASSAVVATKSLSGGQLFCSCLSGSFVDTVEALLAYDPDMIIVEASGLAKPAPLLEIVSVITNRSAGRVTYGGMLCVIDASRYHLLSQAITTLEEQLVFSDAIILNKTDLVDAQALATVTAQVRKTRPLAPYFATTHGAIRPDMLSLWDTDVAWNHLRSIDTAPYKGWGVHGRPKTVVFSIEGKWNPTMVEALLAEVSPQMLRMKGFLPYGNGNALQVDAVGPYVQVGMCDMPVGIETGVVGIHAATVDAKTLLLATWNRIATHGARLVVS